MVAFKSAPRRLRFFKSSWIMARPSPSAVGIPEHLAIGIGNQLVADRVFEEIAWHRRKPTQVEASQPAGPYEFSQVSLSGTGGAHRTKIAISGEANNRNGLIPRCFDRNIRTKA